ncbi:unnamed protein product [Caenorhabditis auriculariae]|uniref:Receptor L-domain domain-containing protein n=1 Tax=Caenorhabditis auriculariae TaxID=2777116 RepID=A0A8S1H988_9PELO|nr:unnamed protein product [Caenorhabditis auriculariae]
MKWNGIEGRFNLKLLLMIALLNACYAVSTQSCCKRPMYAYGSGDAIPPECILNVGCTDALIYADHGRANQEVYKFLNAMLKSSTITLISTQANVEFLEEIIHKGPGPALTLINNTLIANSFISLKKIEVDDVSIYCDGTTDLIKIEGSLFKEVLDRLHKVGNKTLEACKSLTTTQPTVLGATQRAGVPRSNSSAAVISQLCTQKIDAEKEKCSSNNTLLYIACGVIVVLLIVSIVSTIIALKLYFCSHKKDRPSASLGASEKGAQKKAETAKETSKETSQEKK